MVMWWDGNGMGRGDEKVKISEGRSRPCQGKRNCGKPTVWSKERRETGELGRKGCVASMDVSRQRKMWH
jgi:hypothetical protein